MLYIFDTCTDPYWNLAAEEYLLKEHTEPIFRIWRNDNAIIVGHYQNTIAEIDVDVVKNNHIKVVRRITGGGAVFHDLGNVNFTFIEQKNPLEDASAMFARFTKPIIEAINSLGVKAYLEGRNDLLIDGCKFSGNAVCIYKDRVLQHGTMLFSSCMSDLAAALKARPEKFQGKAVQSTRKRVTNISEHLPLEYKDMSATDFQQYILDFIMERYGGSIYEYTPKDIEAIDKLCAEKYSQEAWNFGSSPNYSFSNVKKLSGGIVEFYFDVEGGLIRNFKVYGDYFFTRPTEEFVEMFEGTPHNYNLIESKMFDLDTELKKSNPLGIGAYFNGIDAREIIGMFFN